VVLLYQDASSGFTTYAYVGKSLFLTSW